MILVGLDVFEMDSFVQFRYDLPVVYVNFVGLPVSDYFQGRYNDAPDEIKWFKQLEAPYVQQILNYEWETTPMEFIPEDTRMRRMYHMKLRAWPPLGITREMWWTKRRDQSFALAFDAATKNEILINSTSLGISGDKSYDMSYFLQSHQFMSKGWCSKCANDDDEVFMFRQLNGYRPKGIRLLVQKHSYLKFTSSNIRNTIDRDIRDKKIFIIDASTVGEIPSYTGGYAPILIAKLEGNKLRTGLSLTDILYFYSNDQTR